MKKLFLLIPVLAIATTFVCATPTITIDGDKSDWAEVPMLSEPGTWPMLKVLPAADASMGTNALAFMLENNVAFTSDWSKYPGTYIDKDYNLETNPYNSDWIYLGMGIDYACTTGANPGTGWIDFPKGKSADYKAIELGIPNSYIADLGAKFGIGMYYGTGSSQEWFLPSMSGNGISSPAKSYLYKTRSYTTLPGTVTAANAFAHQSMGECTSYVDFGLRDNGYDTLRWAAFPVILEKPAIYDVTVNVSSTNDWKFEFWLVDVASNTIVAHLNRAGGSSSDATKKLGSLDLTSVPAGKYMLKVQNKKAFSKVKLNSIDITYAGGAKVNLPSTVSVDDAWFSSNGTRTDGVITYSSIGSGCWAKWNVNIPKTGKYDITVNIKNLYGHTYIIEFFETGNPTPVASISESGIQYGHDLTFYAAHVGVLDLTAGDYEMKVSNSVGDAKLISTTVTYAGGAPTAIPGLLKAEDAVVVSPPKKLHHEANGDLKYGDYGTVPTDEYAYWRITTTGAYSGKVTLNIPQENSTGHQFHVELYSDLEGAKLSEAYEAEDNHSKGVIELSQTFEISSSGTYFIKLVNATQWSSAILRSISIAPAITLDEEATSIATVIEPNDGKAVNAQLSRSFTGGMYNTICLPFAVSAAEKSRIFGEATLLDLDDAYVADNILYMNFVKVNEMEAGKPYIISPLANISNPKFLGVTIDKSSNNAEFDDVDFKGTFVQTTIDASEDNLFLGSGNTLYFPTDTKTIKGMRGWFEVHSSSGAPVRQARIVAHGDVVTEVELIGNDLPETFGNKVQKLIENGQLILIRDGVRYNIIGVRVK